MGMPKSYLRMGHVVVMMSIQVALGLEDCLEHMVIGSGRLRGGKNGRENMESRRSFVVLGVVLSNMLSMRQESFEQRWNMVFH